jgi:hypothetical protein
MHVNALAGDPSAMSAVPGVMNPSNALGPYL